VAGGEVDWLDVPVLLGYGAMFLMIALMLHRRRENA